MLLSSPLLPMWNRKRQAHASTDTNLAALVAERPETCFVMGAGAISFQQLDTIDLGLRRDATRTNRIAANVTMQ
jgi:hypothetical protein